MLKFSLEYRKQHYMMFVVYIFQIGVLILLNVINCEVYTSLMNVQRLLHTHENVISSLEHYIEVEENRLNILKRQ